MTRSAGRDNGLRAGRNRTIGGRDDSVGGGSAGFNRAVGSSGLLWEKVRWYSTQCI